MVENKRFCLKSLEGAFKQMLKSMFHPIVEKKNVLIDRLLKGYLNEYYLHIYKNYVMRRVARGNRIVLINKVG